MELKVPKEFIFQTVFGFVCSLVVSIIVTLPDFNLAFSLTFLCVLWALCVWGCVDSCKSLRFDEYGVEVKLLFYKKFYPWESLKTVRIVKSFNIQIVEFSKKKLKKPRILTEYYSLLHPLSFFYMYLRTENDTRPLGYYPDRYFCVESETFYRLMKEWNVSFEVYKLR